MDLLQLGASARHLWACSVTAALLGAFLAYWGWLDPGRPSSWPMVASAMVDPREQPVAEWSVAGIDWDSSRGAPVLQLLVGYDWRMVPVREDCRVRIEIDERRTGKNTSLTLGSEDLQWGEHDLGSHDFEGGMTCRVRAEEVGPSFAWWQLRLVGVWEGDLLDTDFMVTLARVASGVLLCLAIGLAICARRCASTRVVEKRR